jgi:4-diphosphocytidyl-2-C-methyl-D-erythritol kinase
MVIQILAPAKLNLGLEVLEKRADGFHEIRTVFCAISVFDRIQIGSTGTFPALDPNDLAELARIAFRHSVDDSADVSLQVEKRIPVAAGLGGGSSDAAAILRGLDLLRPGSNLACLALELGSDVPFLLSGGIALGSGRGEQLRPLPSRSLSFVLISFDLDIRDKTSMMFGALNADDMTSGESVCGTADLIEQGSDRLMDSAFFNAFQRALYHLFPEVKGVADVVAAELRVPVNLTGAGPTLFVVAPDYATALVYRNQILAIDAIADRFARCICARSVSRIPMVDSRDD